MQSNSFFVSDSNEAIRISTKFDGGKVAVSWLDRSLLAAVSTSTDITMEIQADMFGWNHHCFVAEGATRKVWQGF